MSSAAIVAIPEENDYVWKISSEKIPHLTLLFLGEAGEVKNLDKILDFVKHTSNTMASRFGLEVDRRGELGDENADVLFFSKTRWSGYETVRNFRSNLLKDSNIKTAYDSVEQFSEWIPHLTLGYPATPAKPDNRDYPGINYVNFDRIAVWFGDYEGVEFPLKRYEGDVVAAMSSVGTEVVENILEHYGVKGMKWGVRRERPSAVTVRDRGKKLKTSGGFDHPAHLDAVKARQLQQIGKKSGLKALSNEDLRTYANRLQLEQNVKRLNYQDKNAGQRFVASILGQSGKSLASEGVNKGSKEVGRRALRLAALAA